MPNVRVRPALEKISKELTWLMNYLAEHSSISPQDALFVDNVATGIAEQAAQLAAAARDVQGNRSSESVVRDVRRALGFTSP